MIREFDYFFFQKRIVCRDNKDVINTHGGGLGWWKGNTIRVPSLKRGRGTWKRFYKLFPSLKDKKCLEYGRGISEKYARKIKLKKY